MRIYEGYFNDKESDNDEIVNDIENDITDNNWYEHYIILKYRIADKLVECMNYDMDDANEQFAKDIHQIEKKIRRMQNFTFVDIVKEQFDVINADVDYKQADTPKKKGDVIVMTDKLDRVQMDYVYIRFFLNFSINRIRQIDKFNDYLMHRLNVLSSSGTSYEMTVEGYYIDSEPDRLGTLYNINTHGDETYYNFGKYIMALSCKILENDDADDMCLDYYEDGNAVCPLMCAVMGDNYYKHIDRHISKDIIAGTIKTYNFCKYNMVHVYPCGKLNKPVWDIKIRDYVFSHNFSIAFNATPSEMTVYLVCDGYYYDGDSMKGKQIVTLQSHCSEYKNNDNCDKAGFMSIIEMLRTAGCTDDEVNDVVKNMGRHVADCSMFDDYLKNPQDYLT